MKKLCTATVCLYIVFVAACNLAAQPAWLVRAGYVVGAATPTPFPAEIREIKSFDPSFGWAVGGGAMWAIDSAAQWQVYAGFGVNSMGMTTCARVKCYSTELQADDGTSVKGVWTGIVETEYQALALSPKVAIRYALSPHWHVGAGLY
ncbi:MAG: hypothetical protein KBT04_08330, partial [Bacteroidales bacterium]|nr:hypothetical protein [Candidatus Colimorpha onthohippi]